jgi:hypothetical protein
MPAQTNICPVCSKNDTIYIGTISGLFLSALSLVEQSAEGSSARRIYLPTVVKR